MRRRDLWPALAIAAALIGGLASGLAAPPPGSDPANDSPTAQWFRSLKQPDTGYSCCSIADCRAEPWRQTAAGYEAFLADSDVNDPAWIAVPAEKILQATANPLGRAVTCHAGKLIFCFVREAEG